MATALITGASAGLGASLAQRFAKDGHDVVLVARRVEPLAALAKQLQDLGRKAWCVQADLATPSGIRTVVEFVEKEKLEIEFLVNNAGVGTNGKFWELDPDKEAAQIALNVAAVSALTRAFVPAMVKRGRGRVLNVGSTAGFTAGPFMATYYASKAFVNSFTEALAIELQGTGVTATVSCPGPIATEFAAVAGNDKSQLFKRSKPASADEIAALAYAAMHKGQAMAIHGAKYKTMIFGQRFAPRSTAAKIASKLNRP